MGRWKQKLWAPLGGAQPVCALDQSEPWLSVTSLEMPPERSPRREEGCSPGASENFLEVHSA